MRLKEKLSQLRYMEIDFVYMLRFNSHLAEMPADKFASDILAKALSARYIITGDNFCFGAQRRGNSKFLTEIAAENGFSYRAVEEVKSEEIISSSAIRQALTNGDIGKAQSLLGRAHSICGHVISGEKRGRKLGFPTANLNMQKIFAPRHGVYAVDVAVETEQTIYSGVANIGIKPSFGKNKVSLEAHLFEYCGDLYGKYIKVRLKKFLRDEKKFNSLDELKKQIALDCQQAADHKLTN